MDKHLPDFTVFFQQSKIKKPPFGGFSVTFRLFSYAQKPRYSGAKVKEETESNDLHVISSLNNVYF